ncbi:Prefoldin subunit-domain-containing protein [Durotheca rogersii]|uniref:Prefoldin subunit-domain-containing protein n=1 Tax=Durotheca rogersii TaxID=419775 RepID=UPI00222095B3|nr:Prefoldin subunit-domain-containing protein [Durotheca rogersii]KAI5865798.1 Prefoldin subunit-domain-containing protein [Durotheca rogersii]
MSTIKDSFVNLENHRQKLQDTAERLSTALAQWKRWKGEYEALRSDVKSVPSSSRRQDLKKVRESFKGELLNEKELVDIFGRDGSSKPEQIVSKLTNRLDYVARNIDTLSKQLETVENKLAAVTVVSNPDATDEDGLPITEILEELDDDDNVISYSLRTAGENQPQVLEALEKVGVTDKLPDEAKDATASETSQRIRGSESELSNNVSTSSIQQLKIAEHGESKPSKGVLSRPSEQSEAPQAEEIPKTKSDARKKTVSFTEGTKLGEPEEPSVTAKRLEEILQKARDQQSIISDPIFPADESPEDAALREDMIRYNKETMEFEMAPIVAELQLEEGSSEDDTDDYEDDEDDDEEDEEDEWGRSKIALDDEWKRQMLELKERLSHHTFGKSKASNDEEDLVEGVGRISIRRENGDVSNGDVGTTPSLLPATAGSTPANDSKKSVRFAESLDIGEDSVPATKQSASGQLKGTDIEPLSDVMERKSSAAQPVVAPSKKPSRFRQGRGIGSPMNVKTPTFNGVPIAPEKPDLERHTPSGPEGQTLASSVLEHEPSLEVKEPDEFDANLLHQQVTDEYHKMRNRFMHRQGGFTKEDESPIRPLDEDEGGGSRRISRFKAARLAKS